jgi:hypothetical protein
MPMPADPAAAAATPPPSSQDRPAEDRALILLTDNAGSVVEIDLDPEENLAMLRGEPVDARGRLRRYEGEAAVLRLAPRLGQIAQRIRGKLDVARLT